ncbi:helix-turn-helix domain-containing protein [Amycolatopsis pretoriensis]|uniref:helix-turn-helix domain-containing protein n=1 Tax=Amycolatopsis pretoriensis TaxID=218821 RepID=UPI00115F8CDD|nr:helix-turn-helix transcriptional regulator [Amycolatopsis pretoriensis]
MTDDSPVPYSVTTLRGQYLAGATLRELRAKYDVPLRAVINDVGDLLYSRRITPGVSAVEADRPEVAARIEDPARRRALALMVRRDRHTGWSMGRLSTEYELTEETLEQLITSVDVEILRLRREQVSYAAIGARFGVARDSVGMWVRAAAANQDAALAFAEIPDGPPADLAERTPYLVTDAAAEAFVSAIGSALRRRRRAAGWDARFAAEQIGVSRPALSTHENGTRVMGIDTLLRYAGAYSVTPAELVAEAFAAIDAPAAPRTDAIMVDLAALAHTDRPDLEGLREWARLRAASADHLERFTIPIDIDALEHLAGSLGIEASRLIAALRELERPGPGDAHA